MESDDLDVSSFPTCGPWAKYSTSSLLCFLFGNNSEQCPRPPRTGLLRELMM